MEIIKFERQLLLDLARLGYSIIYIPEYDMYFYPIGNCKFYNPDNNKFDSELVGKDVTTLIKNKEVNIQDKSLVYAKFNNIPDITLFIRYQSKMIQYK